MTRIAIVGDALLDRDLEGRVERLCPEAPAPVVDELITRSRPGGAGLAAALAAADGHDVVLVTALAADEAGRELRGLLAAAGVEVVDLGLAAETPQKVRVRSDGRLLVRLDHGGRRPGRVGPFGEPARAAVRSADIVLVADYGRRVAEAAHDALLGRQVVWDPHVRGCEPAPGARLVTPNAAESRRFAPEPAGDGLRETAARARALAERWSAEAVAITLGANGAVLVEGERPPHVLAAPPVVGGDACGAGDRFATAAAAALAAGVEAGEAVAAAVRSASAFVAAGGAGAFQLEPTSASNSLLLAPDTDDVKSLLARVRAAGGTVVATGGCFDLLHAGHVATLRAARALGDCLVVCLNSDASVRRLKGPDRPLVAAPDRAAVLASLACVDAVVVFEEDTPEAMLERLRPDIWTKGGDYDAGALPEAQAVERWGGQVVILPYVEGHSTSRLLEEAALRGA